MSPLVEELALIGDPVAHSLSDRYHNAILSQVGIPAQYGKYTVRPDTLASFLEHAKQKGMRGLSVTMPLKECIIPLLDEVDDTARAIGAVNTVRWRAGKSYGYNTDIHGAIGAIQHGYSAPLLHKTALIIGAGGVTKAIAYGLQQAGMRLIFSNRTLEKAHSLAQRFEGDVCELDNVPSQLAQCDFLIQATSVGMQDDSMIISPTRIPRHVTVLDVVSAPLNGWLDQLAQQGNLTLSGKLFWIFQAIQQYQVWYDCNLMKHLPEIMTIASYVLTQDCVTPLPQQRVVCS